MIQLFMKFHTIFLPTLTVFQSVKLIEGLILDKWGATILLNHTWCLAYNIIVYNKDQCYSKCGLWKGISEQLLEMHISRPHSKSIQISGGGVYKSAFTSAPQVICCPDFPNTFSK